MSTITTSRRTRIGTGRRNAIGRVPLPRLASAALALGLAFGACGAAQAARFGIRVVDAAGEPVAGASVCIGLEGNYRQFGTAFTDADGRADLVEVPNIPFVVTVSKTRFAGLRRSEPARSYDLVREFTLVEGLPGPRCRAGSSIVANPSVVDVRAVAVAGDGTNTMLTPTVTGEPSEYRLARDGGFSGATWQRFDSTIALPRSLADAPSVALQLRRYEGSERAWIEARSDVVTVDLPRSGVEGDASSDG